MKNILSENMQRFRTKNLSESNSEKLNEGTESNISLNTKLSNLKPMNNSLSIILGGKDYPIEMGSTVNAQLVLQSYGNQAAKVGNSNPTINLEWFSIDKKHPSGASYSTIGEAIEVSSPFKAGNDVPAWHEVVNASKYGRNFPQYNGFKLSGGVKLNTDPNVNNQAGTLSNGEPNYLPSMLYYVIPINFKITPELADLNEKYRNELRRLQKKAKDRTLTTSEKYRYNGLQNPYDRIAHMKIRAGNMNDTIINCYFNKQSIVGFDVTDPR